MIIFPKHFDIDFSASWVGFGKPRSFQNPSNIHQNVLPEPYLFRHRFFIDFFSILNPKTEPPNFKHHQKTLVLWYPRAFGPFQDKIDFGSDLGANLPPCWPPKSKFFLKLGFPRGLQNFIVFRLDFFLLLAPSWPPTWSHLGSQDGIKFEKEASKMYQGCFKSRS